MQGITAISARKCIIKCLKCLLDTFSVHLCFVLWFICSITSATLLNRVITACNKSRHCVIWLRKIKILLGILKKYLSIYLSIIWKSSKTNPQKMLKKLSSETWVRRNVTELFIKSFTVHEDFMESYVNYDKIIKQSYHLCMAVIVYNEFHYI